MRILEDATWGRARPRAARDESQARRFRTTYRRLVCGGVCLLVACSGTDEPPMNDGGTSSDAATTDVPDASEPSTGDAGDALEADAAVVDGATARVTSLRAAFARAYQSPGPDYVKAIATAQNGDILATSLFTGTIVVDPSGTELVADRAIDTAVVVYDPDTGLARAAWAFGGAGNTVPHGIAEDPETGDVVVIGYVGGGGPSVASFSTEASGDRAFSGAEKPFVARYDREGNLVWAHVLDGTDATGAAAFSRAWDLAVDSEGNSYVVGHFQGTFDLDPGPSEHALTSVGGSTDLFVVKLSRSGLLQYAFSLGGPASDAGNVGSPVSPGGNGECAVAIHEGSLYVQGTFEASMEIRGATGDGRADLLSRGSADLFVARFDASDGSFIQALQVGGPNDEVATPGALRIAADGRLFFAARADGAIEWGGVGSGFTPGEGSAVSVVSLDAGLGFRWAARLASTGRDDGIHRVLPADDDRVFVAGWHSGRTDFDPSAGAATRAAPPPGGAGTDPFLLLLRDEEDHASFVALAEWSAAVEHETTGIPAGLALDLDGRAWVGGQFFVASDLTPGVDDGAVTVAGASDAFVTRMDLVTDPER